MTELLNGLIMLLATFAVFYLMICAIILVFVCASKISYRSKKKQDKNREEGK